MLVGPEAAGRFYRTVRADATLAGFNLKHLEQRRLSKPLAIFSTMAAWRCSFVLIEADERARRPGRFNLGQLILSILAREVACLAFETLAEKR